MKTKKKRVLRKWLSNTLKTIIFIGIMFTMTTIDTVDNTEFAKTYLLILSTVLAITVSSYAILNKFSR